MKRGEPKGGGQFINSEHATGIIPIAEPEFTKVRINENPLLKVPPASRGNRTRARFPSRSGGNLQEGGNCKLRPRDWYKMHEHTDEVIVNYTCTAGISLLGTTLAIGVYKSSLICLFLVSFGRFRLTLLLCVGYTFPAHARRAT